MWWYKQHKNQIKSRNGMHVNSGGVRRQHHLAFLKKKDVNTILLSGNESAITQLEVRAVQRSPWRWHSTLRSGLVVIFWIHLILLITNPLQICIQISIQVSIQVVTQKYKLHGSALKQIQITSFYAILPLSNHEKRSCYDHHSCFAPVLELHVFDVGVGVVAD